MLDLADGLRGWRAHQFRQGGTKIVGLEAEGAGLGFEGHAPLPIDQIDSIRPSGVGAFGAVAELIEHGGKLDAQLAHAGAGDESAFVFTLGRRENDLIFDIALHLPYVAGVRFQNVHDQKRDLAAILIIELVEGGNLPPEGRSGVTSENEHYRLSGSQRRQLDAVRLVELEK